MYDVACYGQVIGKTEDEIEVQFYTRKKTTPSDYILKKKDTDKITTQRQGYIFYHLKKVRKVLHEFFGILNLFRTISSTWSRAVLI